MRLPLRLVATISVSVVCAVGMVWLAFWDNRYLDDPTKTSKEEHTAEFKQSKSQKFAHDIVGPGANGSSSVIEMSFFSETEQGKMRGSYKDHGFNGYLSDIVPLDRKLKDPRPHIQPAESKKIIHIAVVVCQRKRRLEQALVMLKSAVLFAHTKLVFHIFADDVNLQSVCRRELNMWPVRYLEKVSYHIYNVSFPHTSNVNSKQWKQMYAPCATQRLFFPSLLPDVDALIYVDTDTVFLSPVEDLWSLFLEFSSTHLMAISTARESPNAFDRSRNIPIPGNTGVGLNSGVMLMNLTRIRASNFTTCMDEYYKFYGNRLRLGDQDLLNVYFHFHNHELSTLPCQWNYCFNYCHTGEPNSKCNAAETNGVRLLHGKVATFELNNQPMFRAMHMAFAEFDLESNAVSDLPKIVDKHMENVKPSMCEKVKHIFIKQIEIFVNSTRNIGT